MTTSGSSRNDRTRFVLAAIAAVVGTVWVLQGLGLLPGSFMTGDGFWAVAGLVMIGAAAASVLLPRLRRR